ncbi:glucanase B [Xylaria sp. CBS 124048]|nr:glucanase B [Xylaria sp. CBS 124048]
MTPPTTQIAFKNNTGSSRAYAYVTGLDINKNYAYAFLQPDGKTVFYPASPSAPLQPLGMDCAIPMGAPGSTTTVTIPQLAGGRIWFVVDGKLTFFVNPGPGIVEPSVTNTSDVNYNLKWGFAEFTCLWLTLFLPNNQQQLFVNISYVDFVSIPISLQLLNTAGKTQTVRGLPANGLEQVCSQLAQQASENPGWGKLVVKGPDGRNLRALSPNSGRVGDSSLFNGYYQPFVDQAWSKYANTDLKVDTQADWGVVTGRVGSNGLMTFPNIGSFAKPSSIDIFSCSTGPFGNYPSETRDVMGAIGARLAASLNRSTLIANPNQPDVITGPETDYYKTNPTNHYARIVHGVNLDGRGYAFPYDDVAASASTGPDQAGTVYDGSPKLLTVTIGGPDGGPAGGRVPKGRIPGGKKSVVGGGDNSGNDPDGGEKKKKTKKRFDIPALLGTITTILKSLICK